MRKGIAMQTNRFEARDPDSGGRLLGLVNIQLPAFEVSTNEFTGAGVGGSINIPAPGVMNALTITMSVPKVYGELINFLKLGTVRTLDLYSDVVVQNTETHGYEYVQEHWILKGAVTKCDPGKIAQKSAGDATIEMQVTFAQHWFDGDELLEWDAFNAVHKVNGEDLLEETRKNLML